MTSSTSPRSWVLGQELRSPEEVEAAKKAGYGVDWWTIDHVWRACVTDHARSPLAGFPHRIASLPVPPEPVDCLEPLRELAEKWLVEARLYPDTERGRGGATAVATRANELKCALATISLPPVDRFPDHPRITAHEAWEAVQRGDRVERLFPDGSWVMTHHSYADKAWKDRHDFPVTVRITSQPATERVKWWEARGRKLAKNGEPIVEVRFGGSFPDGAVTTSTTAFSWFAADSSGEVEVLAGEEE